MITMMKMRWSPGLVVALAVTVAALPAAPGLALEIDPAAVRGQLVLPQEPAGAIAPTAAKEKLGARGMEPFLDNKASFVLVEIPADDHAKKPGHNADDCPFCKKKQANVPMTAVQFLGADGKVIPVDSRKLFGIQKGSDVVVTGKAVFDPKLAIPIIQLTADGIFVRPPAK
jgi:hypothetical protein